MSERTGLRAHILPVSPKTCTVLGQRAKDELDPLWAGLDMSRARLRTRSTIMLACVGDKAPFDLHLDVPWCHPNDRTGSPDDFDCVYRVRPKAEPGKRFGRRRVVQSVGFKKDGSGVWTIIVQSLPHPGPSHD